MNDGDKKIQIEEEKIIEFLSKMELYDKGIYDFDGDIDSWITANDGGDFIE